VNLAVNTHTAYIVCVTDVYGELIVGPRFWLVVAELAIYMYNYILEI